MPVILTQTDTTVGFLSQDAQKLYEIKSRPQTKPFIKVYKDFKSFLEDGNRVEKKRKNLVRRSKKTTFILNNFSFRVAKIALDSQILRETPWFYSTSANKSAESFNRDFCESKADIIVENWNSLSEKDASSLIKINSLKRKKLR
ncbi:Sua5/YciO/YrdC/YwlC family protein [Sulfurimonas sp.]|jgi:tRNA A37 threonylcarbamoyladenosine synthetase subunit TsaC/SUA5/YrdC|uniref:Sua5/YciO/YrdC/YwlC family protein n=1 Tax=Sulfurimonas sp. TaxID=2022749 RepID=UPI0025CE24D9|nr:Sua5/YciO/YrdC/YwlC family protein [Sulfurimonas sp.]MCK9473834.1 Sua5/YciO/YrdC/YwlC family protein [Sulfurimonas sp.]